ncbi:MAG: sulfatase [Opitutaceae bacterium]|nr:sulfatase [Opitutaceae bacterium]
MKYVLTYPAFACLIVGIAANPRPNIVWLLAEDMSPNLGAYGDPDAQSPTLDRLAARGVRYERAFTVAGVCAPSRSSLITGMYASSLGSQHMRCIATLSAETPLLPALLRKAGYYCTNNVKEDYNFVTPRGAWDESSRKAHWRNRSENQPFFSVFDFKVTHEQFLRATPEQFARAAGGAVQIAQRDGSRLKLPAWLPDTPAVRKEWARYHEMITALDRQVAALLLQLQEDGLEDETIVIFFSDHGAGFPRAKQFLYDSSTRVPLIVYCPPRWRHLLQVPAGTADRQLVSTVDLAPTVLSVAGIEPPAMMPGRVFLGSSTGEPREYVYGIRDRMDERCDTSRTVRNDRFRYHRNYRPDLPHFPGLTYMDLLQTSQEFRRLAKVGGLPVGLTHFMAARQGIEELYDIQSDPAELQDLSANPDYAMELRRLRKLHFDWVRATRDTGLIPEQMLRDFAVGGSEYAYAHSDAYQLDRCIDTVRLMEDGANGLAALAHALVDEYPPVRYWAAVGLGVLGKKAQPAAELLGHALEDSFSEVALAAAEALGQIGDARPALPVVARLLENGRPLEALVAGNVADRLGDAARPIADVLLRVAATKPVGDLGLMRQWIVVHALSQIDQASMPVAKAGNLTDAGVAPIEITPEHPIRLSTFPRLGGGLSIGRSLCWLASF